MRTSVAPHCGLVIYSYLEADIACDHICPTFEKLIELSHFTISHL